MISTERKVNHNTRGNVTPAPGGLFSTGRFTLWLPYPGAADTATLGLRGCGLGPITSIGVSVRVCQSHWGGSDEEGLRL